MGRAAGWAALAIAAWIAGCGGGRSVTTGQPAGMPSIEEVLERYTDSLLSTPGVVGVAQGEQAGRPIIQVFVARRTPELVGLLPAMLDGYPVEIVETGEIRARDSGR